MPQDELVNITRSYYDSDDADRFYHSIWGGEDIHVGIYEEGDSIAEASQKTVIQMLKQLPNITERTHILDVGAGYGGAARYIARQTGCKITCLNLSTVENQRNREKTKEMGLDHLIEVVDGNFEALPFEDSSFEVVWSEDAILHSGAKRKVFEECHRVLKAAGKMIFTDPMQADNCPTDVLGPVLERIHLEEMGSVALYRSFAAEQGWRRFHVWEMPKQLVNHYSRVLAELNSRKEELSKEISPLYIQRMEKGLSDWITAGKNGFLNWGIMLMEK